MKYLNPICKDWGHGRCLQCILVMLRCLCGSEDAKASMDVTRFVQNDHQHVVQQVSYQNVNQVQEFFLTCVADRFWDRATVPNSTQRQCTLYRNRDPSLSVSVWISQKTTLTFRLVRKIWNSFKHILRFLWSVDEG